jgi:glutamyl-tRNA reductase
LRPDNEKQRTMLSRLAGMADGRMVLSTCERFEVYATTLRTEAAEWIELLSQWFHLPISVLARFARARVGSDAAEHLLRVAAGLESRIVGEAQILGQVRDAFLQATLARALDPVLSALGRAAIRTGKRVRHESLINCGARSIATLAMEHVIRNLGTLHDRTILILGSGKLAGVVAAELARFRARRIIVVGRNVDRAAAVAQEGHGVSLGMDQLAVALGDSDALIACTSSPFQLVDSSMIGRDRVRPLCLVDLSVPRNIDPAVTQLDGVGLTHLDELVEGQSAREDGIAAAGRIVDEELARYNGWREQRWVAPLIAQLVREGRGADKQALHSRIVRLKAGVAA